MTTSEPATLSEALGNYVDALADRTADDHHIATIRHTLDNTRGYRLAQAGTIRPRDSVARVEWNARWQTVDIVDHHQGGTTLHLYDGTTEWMWSTEQIKVKLRTGRCACGAVIGPLEQWCSRACYEAENGFEDPTTGEDDR